jgi:hypothetical protein
MDMKYYWLQDRVPKKQFDVYWLPGKDNLGDYHIKHHTAQHHQDMHHKCSAGCVKLPQPKLRKFTDTQTSQRTLRSTQVRCALARAYTVILQNRPFWHLV